MKVLFVVSDVFFGEPIGLLQLSSCLKARGHETKLLVIKKHSVGKILNNFQPDIIAYSVMSSEAPLVKEADVFIKQWVKEQNKPVLCIMGGPHPTFFPEILNEMQLDAVCIGDGDNAIVEIASRHQNRKSLFGIANVLSPGEKIEEIKKELISEPELDKLPWIDREIFYEAMPLYRALGFRGFMVGRGCPYSCTYCHNHAKKEIFKDCGKIVRRRSVANVIEEMKHVVSEYSPVRLIKISDDTFAHVVDEWLLEFLERYKKEINLPFYCLMRSNTLTEEMAKLLRSAGCVAVSMAVESGDEKIRNNLLKRNLSDQLVKDSFLYARKHKLHTYGNTLLALPGTTFADDFNSFLFAKKLKLTAPTFGVFNPYPRLELTNYAISHGYLDPNYDASNMFGFKSPLNCFSEKEKSMQLRLAYLGPIFADLPDFFIPLLKLLIRVNALPVYKLIGYTYHIYKVAFFIFPGSIPLNPVKSFNIFLQALKYYTPRRINSRKKS